MLVYTVSYVTEIINLHSGTFESGYIIRSSKLGYLCIGFNFDPLLEYSNFFKYHGWWVQILYFIANYSSIAIKPQKQNNESIDNLMNGIWLVSLENFSQKL